MLCSCFCARSLFQPNPQNAITIAVSSRALFRMEEEQKIYEEHGVEEYVKYQLEHEDEPFEPGAAFPFVKVRTPAEPILPALFQYIPGTPAQSILTSYYHTDYQGLPIEPPQLHPSSGFFSVKVAMHRHQFCFLRLPKSFQTR